MAAHTNVVDAATMRGAPKRSGADVVRLTLATPAQDSAASIAAFDWSPLFVA
jgi:hypothetical protein